MQTYVYMLFQRIGDWGLDRARGIWGFEGFVGVDLLLGFYRSSLANLPLTAELQRSGMHSFSQQQRNNKASRTSRRSQATLRFQQFGDVMFATVGYHREV